MEDLQVKAQTVHHPLFLVYNFGQYYSRVNCSVIRNILCRQMKDFTGKDNGLLCAFRILMYVSGYWSAMKIKLVAFIKLLLRMFTGLVGVIPLGREGTS
jgi:hypothetical protein